MKNAPISILSTAVLITLLCAGCRSHRESSSAAATTLNSATATATFSTSHLTLLDSLAMSFSDTSAHTLAFEADSAILTDNTGRVASLKGIRVTSSRRKVSTMNTKRGTTAFIADSSRTVGSTQSISNHTSQSDTTTAPTTASSVTKLMITMILLTAAVGAIVLFRRARRASAH